MGWNHQLDGSFWLKIMVAAFHPGQVMQKIVAKRVFSG